MVEDRAPVGLLVAALGAVVLALSVFAPWYGVRITASNATEARQELSVVARQYGNAAVQTPANGPLTGLRVATVTAHQATKRVSLILLALAGVALLTSVLRLANTRGLLFATGSQIALLGTLAVLVVFFRILWRPDAGLDWISFSLGWGVWLALFGSAAIAGGALLAGSDRASTRARRKVGPGPPPLGLGMSQRPH